MQQAGEARARREGGAAAVGGDSSRRTAARFVRVIKLLLLLSLNTVRVFSAGASHPFYIILQQMAVLRVQDPVSSVQSSPGTMV